MSHPTERKSPARSRTRSGALPSSSIYLEAAREMVRLHGYLEAIRLCTVYRDMNSPGTFSYAHHNAVRKHIVVVANESGRAECHA